MYNYVISENLISTERFIISREVTKSYAAIPRRCSIISHWSEKPDNLGHKKQKYLILQRLICILGIRKKINFFTAHSTNVWNL